MKRNIFLRDTIKNDKYKKKGLCANDVDSLEALESGSSCEDKKNEFMLMAIDDFD